MAPIAAAAIGAIKTVGVAQSIGIGLAVAGKLQAGAAASAEAKNRQAIAEYNARVQEQQAKQIRAKTSFEQIRQAEEAERVKGRLVARAGAAGAVSTVGTPLLIEAKQASELELENLMIGYEGMIEERRALSKAEIDKAQAGIYGQRAKYAKRAGYLGAGRTLLTGFAPAFE